MSVGANITNSDRTPNSTAGKRTDYTVAYLSWAVFDTTTVMGAVSTGMEDK